MKSWSFSVKAAILVFLVFGVVTTIQLSTEISELEDKMEDIDAQRAELSEYIDGRLDELEREEDKEFIMRFARERLNMFMPNETIFYNDIAKSN